MQICKNSLKKLATSAFDLLTAFGDVLGQKASHVSENFEAGELVVDTAMDLETNTTKGYFRENSLLLQQGRVLNNAIVKIAQTFRTGTNDVSRIIDDVISQFHRSLEI